jgi:hypothetical protein
MATAIDRYIGLEWLKRQVDTEHKQAKLDAEDMLARKRQEDGVMELTSKAFGPEAGSYKYSKTRKKRVVEYHLASSEELREWLEANPQAATWFVMEHVEQFGEEWFDSTGECADGMTRVEYEVPAKMGAPKLYGFDPKVVESHLGKNLVGGIELLLGDSHE